MRIARTAFLVAAFMTAATVMVPAPAQAADRVVTFTTTGTHEVVVPAGATSVRVVAQGGSGQSLNGSLSGAGALVKAELQVTAGEVLTATVGGNASEEIGGFNGGANGFNPASTGFSYSGGGGGATDLRRGGAALSNRVLVAGGGGGSDLFPGADGGTASGLVGGAGLSTDTCPSTAGGGTQTAGGVAGAPCNGTAGTSGTLGMGGIPGYRDSGNNMGGGGGGGYYGGGGGSPFSGGGAGSSYVDAAGADISMAAGVLYAAPFITLTFRMPPATGISLVLSQVKVAADGASIFTATATIRDSESRPVTGETVVFSSTDAGQQIGPTTDYGDGTYSAKITSSITVGNVTVKASSGALSDMRSMVQTVGPPAKVLFLNPPVTAPADGTTALPLSFAVLDAQDRYVVPSAIQVGSTDPKHRMGAFNMPISGIYVGSLTTSTSAGDATISVQLPGTSPVLEDSFTLTQTPGAAHALSAVLGSTEFVADGTSGTTLAITSADEFGNPLSAQPITVTSTDPDVELGTVVPLGNGNYAVDLLSSTVAGDVTLTVTDASVDPALVRTVVFSQVAGAPVSAMLTLDDAWLYADGASETTLVAEIADAFGNPVSGLPVGANSSDAGQRFGGAVETGDGVYELRVQASAQVGTNTLSVGVAGPLNTLLATADATPLQPITLALPLVSDEAPAPLAEVLGTIDLEQRAKAVPPGPDTGPAKKAPAAALPGTGSEQTLLGWSAAALLMAGAVLLLTRRTRRER